MKLSAVRMTSASIPAAAYKESPLGNYAGLLAIRPFTCAVIWEATCALAPAIHLRGAPLRLSSMRLAHMAHAGELLG